MASVYVLTSVNTCVLSPAPNQLSVISYQLSVTSYQLSVISYQLSVIQLSVIRCEFSYSIRLLKTDYLFPLLPLAFCLLHECLS
jgi:hypothetical protein